MGCPEETSPLPSQYIFESIKQVKKQYGFGRDPQSIDLENQRQEAYREGFQKGLEDGFKKGEADYNSTHIQELQSYLNELERRLQLFEEQKQEWMSHFEKELSLLSLYITERLLHKCFTDDRDWVQQSTLEIAREALSQITQEGKVRMYLNPFDLVYVQEHYDVLKEVAPKLHHIELVADRSIPGGCFVETDNGVIDSRVDHMLRKIIEDILN